MNREYFLKLALAMLGTSHPLFGRNAITPETLQFLDDGVVPNSKYPLLLYKNVFSERGDKGARWIEEKFLSNNWSNSWRNGIFTFQHYHSITHEALGIYSGEAEVLLGGDLGTTVTVHAGDIILIPAGVGHKNMGSRDLGVVGAYPNGMPVDLIRADPEERPRVDKNIANVPLPDTDPFLGKFEGVKNFWK